MAHPVASPVPACDPPVRIMVVDDSAVVRGLVARWIEAEPDLVLAGVACDGDQAVRRIGALDPEVVVLDVEMPVASGLEALPRLLAARPGVKVVMASTLTRQGAAVTLKALELGAADYIPKPESTRLGGAEAYRAELLEKARRLALAARGRAAGGGSIGAFATLSVSPRRIDVLAIGASTGGPPALRAFLEALGPGWPTPVLVVQHMPASFTRIMAEHLDRACPATVREAEHGERLAPGCVYVAPGGFHLRVRSDASGATAALDQEAPENWCRPAVDPMFRSVAAAYGRNAVGVILTGMGVDGREGARALASAGGVVLAQDEASSVIWGMPGAAAEAGLCALVAPVSGLAAACRRLSQGRAP